MKKFLLRDLKNTEQRQVTSPRHSRKKRSLRKPGRGLTAVIVSGPEYEMPNYHKTSHYQLTRRFSEP